MGFFKFIITAFGALVIFLEFFNLTLHVFEILGIPVWMIIGLTIIIFIPAKKLLMDVLEFAAKDWN